MRENGFTLVELLAAMVAGSLLLIALGWATGQIGREVRPSPLEKEAGEAAAAADVFRHAVEAALPRQDGSNPVQVDDRRLSATIPAPAALGPVEPIKIELSVRKENANEALYAQVEPGNIEQQLPDTALEATRIAGGFKTIRFVEDPANSGQSPAAVQLVLDGRQSRSFWARPRITSSGACIFDPIVGRCR